MILRIWRNTFTKREKRIKSQYVRIVSLFKIKDLRLGADVLEFLHSSEDLVRIASICCQSHVKIAIKYDISRWYQPRPQYIFSLQEEGEKKALEHFKHVIKIWPKRGHFFQNKLRNAWAAILKTGLVFRATDKNKIKTWTESDISVSSFCMGKDTKLCPSDGTGLHSLQIKNGKTRFTS